VVRLEYESYEPMAAKAMAQVCQSVRQRWNVENIAIHHRLGLVPVKEASIVVAVSSAHRAEALDAVHFAINALKATVPIWKKEVYDGDAPPKWQENKECAWAERG
jgi:molybdopterin synthase catalytic subunit